MKSDRVIKFLIVSILILSSIIHSISAISNNEKSIQQIEIIVGPYPQNANTDFIEIIWETNEKTTKNKVHWGLTLDLGNISSELYEETLLNQNLHIVNLDGLSSSTKYYYKVVSDSIESEIYSFYTTFERNNTVRFIAYGDTRGVWDNWQHASIVANKIEEHKPHFVLHTGDIVNDGKNKSQWVDFFSISQFVHNSTLYPVLGNHEHYGISYFRYFSLPHNERWYSIDNGPVHFVGLDSNPRNALKLSQLLWLIKDLRANKQPFTIVFFHHPLYSSGNHGSTLYLRWLWRPIFEHFNVDIVFNGHDHNYERGRVKDVNYIVTGGGGAPPYNVGESWWTIYSEKTYHYCLITANQSKLTFQSIKPDGSLIESFMITK